MSLTVDEHTIYNALKKWPMQQVDVSKLYNTLGYDAAEAAALSARLAKKTASRSPSLRLLDRRIDKAELDAMAGGGAQNTSPSPVPASKSCLGSSSPICTAMDDDDFEEGVYDKGPLTPCATFFVKPSFFVRSQDDLRRLFEDRYARGFGALPGTDVLYSMVEYVCTDRAGNTTTFESLDAAASLLGVQPDELCCRLIEHDIDKSVAECGRQRDAMVFCINGFVVERKDAVRKAIDNTPEIATISYYEGRNKLLRFVYIPFSEKDALGFDPDISCMWQNLSNGVDFKAVFQRNNEDTIRTTMKEQRNAYIPGETDEGTRKRRRRK